MRHFNNFQTVCNILPKSSLHKRWEISEKRRTIRYVIKDNVARFARPARNLHCLGNKKDVFKPQAWTPHCDDHFFRSHLHKKWMIWLHKDSKFTCVKAAKIGFRTLVLVIILEMRGMCVFNRPQQQSHKKRWFSWDNHLEWMPSLLKN